MFFDWHKGEQFWLGGGVDGEIGAAAKDRWLVAFAGFDQAHIGSDIQIIAIDEMLVEGAGDGCAISRDAKGKNQQGERRGIQAWRTPEVA